MTSKADMVRKLFKAYDMHSWTEERFGEYRKNVFHGAYNKIHKISLEKGKTMYLIPEDLFELLMSF